MLAGSVRADYAGRGRFATHHCFAFTAAALGAISVRLIPSPLATANQTAGL